MNVGGAGSQWIVATEVDVGFMGSGTLNIGYGGCGGLVAAYLLNLSFYGGMGVCNLDGGATLRAVLIEAGNVNAQFNWNDGTIENDEASADLHINPALSLKLAATGTHALISVRDARRMLARC